MNEGATEKEVKNKLKNALSNLDIENKEKKELFDAIWDNFELFEIIGFQQKEGQPFLTSINVRKFKKDNFCKAFQTGQMNVDDLFNILF